MTHSGAAEVVRALEDEGVELAFGIPGTHNIELYDALAGSTRVHPILITDEQSAGYLADGAWRASGVLACVNVVPGAGLTHSLSGIAEAYLDGIPMLVLGCGIRRDSGRAFQLHDVDQLAIARPVTKAAVRSPDGAAIYATIREACALARAGPPGPVMVEIPADQYLLRPTGEPLSPAWVDPDHRPAGDLVDRVADLLQAPDARPLLYLGLGAAPAGADLVRLAVALGGPVATTISGKGVFPESHPLFAWNGFGASAPRFVRDLVADATVTLAIGCRFSEVGTASYACEPKGALVHVDVDPAVLGRNYPAAVAVPADAGAFVPALLARLTGVPSRARGDAVAAALREGRAALAAERRSREGSDRVSPAALFPALQATFGPDTVYATDSGNGTFLAMEHLVLDRPRSFLAPVDYSSMGYSVPAAIGAKLACPGRPVVALPGDGAFLMTGLELLTAASQEAAVAVFVLRDRELAQIAQFQRTAFNRPAQTLLPDFDVGSIAEAVGVEWLRLDRDREIPEVLAWARDATGAGRPIVIDTAIDYSQPTFFTSGVVKTTLGRLPFKDRLRFIARAVGRRLLPTT